MRRIWIPALVISAASLAQAQTPITSEEVLGPVVGHVDSESALLWARAEGIRSFTVKVDGGAAREVPFDELGRGFGSARVDGLEPDQVYRLEVVVPGGGKSELSFRSAPLPADHGTLRFAAGSCARWDAQPVWDHVAAAAPEMFLWLGDNTYYMGRKEGGADWDSVDNMLERHLRSRRTPNLLAAMKTMASYATWDDHDYGPNNSDRRWRLRSEARLVHQYMWTNPGAGEQGRGVYFSFRRGPLEFFFLDARTFKDVDKKLPRERRQLYGERQLDWLRRGISASTAPLKVIAAGQQQLLGYPYAEGWDQAPVERKTFLDWLREEGSRVLFLSGDIHVSELYKVPTGRGDAHWWELTASGLANTSRYNEMFRLFQRPQRKWVATEPNFCLVEVDLPKGAPEDGSLRVTCVSAKGKVLEQTTIPFATFGPGRGSAPKRVEPF